METATSKARKTAYEIITEVAENGKITSRRHVDAGSIIDDWMAELITMSALLSYTKGLKKAITQRGFKVIEEETHYNGCPQNVHLTLSNGTTIGIAISAKDEQPDWN